MTALANGAPVGSMNISLLSDSLSMNTSICPYDKTFLSSVSKTSYCSVFSNSFRNDDLPPYPKV